MGRRLGSIVFFLLCLRAPARAGSFLVDRSDDDASASAQACTAAANDCSLRGAIIKANGDATADTITLPTGLYTLSLAGVDEDAAATGDLDITHDLTITGANRATTIIDGAQLDRVFQTDPTASGTITVTIQHVTIQHGKSPDAGTVGGGGIRNGAFPGGTTTAGTLNLIDVVVSSNGSVGVGGGISNEGVMTIADSTVDDNTATGNGAGIVQGDFGSLAITNSVINANVAASPGTSGGGLFMGFFSVTAPPVVTIDGSTISSNDAGSGGGIFRNRGSLTITNSTISGNTSHSGPGGGIYDAGGYVSPLLLVNCTIADNTVTTAGTPGGGIFNTGITTGLETELANTIVAGNHADIHVDYEGTLASQGYNLIGDANGVSIDAPHSNAVGDQMGVANPHLGPLASNGGFTRTHALLAGSPAIDAGNPAASDGTGFHCGTTDQIGTTRPVDGDGSGTARCDIGAFEVAVVPTTPTPTATAAATHTATPTRTATPVPTATHTATPSATHTATPSATTTPVPTSTATPGPEICGDCIDDDGNGLVDRADPSCTLPTGGGLGLGDAVRGKALLKCAGTLQKSGAKLEAKRLARLQKCVDAAFACAEVKSGDAACYAKAKTGCDTSFAALAADAAAFTASVGKKCGAPAVAAADLVDVHGLGYATQDATCADLGAATPTDAASVAACVARVHACRADAALGTETPRAAELLALVGHQASELQCLPAGSGAGAGLGDAKRGKLAAKCEQAAKKAGGKLVGTELKTAQKCATAVLGCIELKPNDAKCLGKAQASCAKSFGKLANGTSGLGAKLAAAVDKACQASGLTLADVLAPTGVGFGSLAGVCAPTGADVDAGVPSVARCLTTYHECRAAELAEAELPRIRELLSLAGVSLP